MKQFYIILKGLFIVAACLLMLEGCSSQAQSGAGNGSIAHDFNLVTLSGDNISLSGLRSKPVLLNFWATWCPPCKAEMPLLQEIHDSWGPRGLVVLEVDIGEKPETVQNFLTENKLSLTVALDSDGRVASDDYLVGAIPTTFFIDKDGIIRDKVIGSFPNRAAIEKELGKIMP